MGKKKERKKGERERSQLSNKSSIDSDNKIDSSPVVKILVLQTEDVRWCSVILLERQCPKNMCVEKDSKGQILQCQVDVA